MRGRRRQPHLDPVRRPAAARAAATAVLAAALAVSAAGMPAAQAATGTESAIPPPVSIERTGAVAGDPAAGTVGFDVTIGTGTYLVPVSLTVNLQPADGTVTTYPWTTNTIWTQTLELTDCDSGCTRRVDLDSVAAVGSPDTAVDWLLDESVAQVAVATVQLRPTRPFEPTASSRVRSEQFVVDNHRWRLTSADPHQSSDASGERMDMRLRLTPMRGTVDEAAADGHLPRLVQLTDPWTGTKVDVPVSPDGASLADGVSRDGEALLAATTLSPSGPNGRRYVIGWPLDADGHRGSKLLRAADRYAPGTGKVSAWVRQLDCHTQNCLWPKSGDVSRTVVEVAFSQSTDPTGQRPALTMYLDGQLLRTTPVHKELGGFYPPTEGHARLAFYPPSYAPNLSPGRHTLRVLYHETVRDVIEPDGTRVTRAETAETSTTFDVLGAHVTSAVAGVPAEGGTATMTATATGSVWPAGSIAPGRTTRLYALSITTADGTVLGSAGCPALDCAAPDRPQLPDTLTLRVPLGSLPGGTAGHPASHRLQVTAVDETRTRWTQDVTVVVAPRVVARVSAPSALVYGTSGSVSALTTDVRGTAIGGLPATLQHLPAGTTSWRAVATATTNASGRATFAVRPATSGSWRVVTTAVAGRGGPATSAAVRTTVAQKVAVSGVPATSVAGRRYPVTVALAPARASARLSVQTLRPGGVWRTIATVSTDRYGRATLPVVFARGTTSVRVVTPATSTLGAGTSPTYRTTAG